MIAITIVSAVIIVILSFVLVVTISDKNGSAQQDETPTAFSTEYRTELEAMVAELNKTQARLLELASKGMDLYNSIPKGLNRSNLSTQLDSDNWCLLDASECVKEAVEKIKEAME